MEQTRDAYLAAATSAVTLLREPAVGKDWLAPSALAGLTVGGLAAHLARQVLRVPEVLAAPATDRELADVLGHYTRSAWVTAGIDDQPNLTVRHASEQDAAGGAAAVLRRTEAALTTLREALPAEPAGRIVHPPWTSWSLTLDDFLLTRLVELAVHSDDLAVSVGVATPALPPPVLDPVLALLTRLAARRHGPTAVLRALSRAERAPEAISAF